MQHLKDEIAKREIEIRAKKREYKDIVDSKLDHLAHQSPSPVKIGAGGGGVSGGESSKLDKLQQDMKMIKELLTQDIG